MTPTSPTARRLVGLTPATADDKPFLTSSLSFDGGEIERGTEKEGWRERDEQGMRRSG